MRRLLQWIPVVVAVIVIAVVWYNLPEKEGETTKTFAVTTSSLMEFIETEKLTTAEYVQHGIAKAQLEGTKPGYVLYYAVVRAYITPSNIEITVDQTTKSVTVNLPEEFSFDVRRLDEADGYEMQFYPDNKKDWSAKDVVFICEEDALQKARENTHLIDAARNNLRSIVQAILNPILSANGYSLIIQ